MLRSVHGQTILLSARSSVVRAYSSRPWKLRLVPSVVLAILLFPLIASLKEQAAVAQISPGQTYPAQTYPGQTYPGQTYPSQTYPAQTYPGQTYPGQTYPSQTYPAQTYTAHTHRATHRAGTPEQHAGAHQQTPQNPYNHRRRMM